MEAGQTQKQLTFQPTASYLTSVQKSSDRDVFVHPNPHPNPSQKDALKRKNVFTAKWRIPENVRTWPTVRQGIVIVCVMVNTTLASATADNPVVQRPDVTGSQVHHQIPAYGNTTIFHSSAKPCRSDVLLKTAVAPVYADGISIAANKLLDEGAQRSFITQTLAERLHLKRDGNDVIHLSAFGDPAHTVQKLDTATVKIEADDGGMIPIRVLIVPVIAKQINNRFRKSIMDMPYLRTLKLAHPITMDETFEISLLIGADFYWEIVGDKTIRGAVSSRIGYFLSGPTTTQLRTSFSTAVDVIVTHVSETEDLARFWDKDSLDS
ncbi:hypothetical protein MAR_034590 [Mya arenaria]|uniref:DUF1758 domain-containing protein n=1 Tax=Mya arenaria TaxID=6604 RepID=A0ABY7EM96_MYAAR|nr:hypothetical protein MAR_034590 [Mya arenaria]